MNIKRVIKHSKFLGEGIDGTCYEMKSGRVLKLFKEPKPKSEMEKFEKFMEFKNDSILFPCELVKSLTSFKGYVTEKAKGECLLDTYMDINLTDFSKALSKLDADIDYISTGALLVKDIHPGNVFFDGNRITLIDPDRYYFYWYDEEKTRDVNLRRIEEMLYDMLKESVKDFEERTKVIHEFRSYLLYDIDTYTLLNAYRAVLDGYADKKCETIREYQRVLKKR